MKTAGGQFLWLIFSSVIISQCNLKLCTTFKRVKNLIFYEAVLLFLNEVIDSYSRVLLLIIIIIIILFELNPGSSAERENSAFQPYRYKKLNKKSFL
jgi:hypothetical protein